jgi:hypothetical protein
MSAPQDEPTQRTPEGATIPVPRRGDFLHDLRKVTKADEREDADGEDSDPDK